MRYADEIDGALTHEFYAPRYYTGTYYAHRNYFAALRFFL